MPGKARAAGVVAALILGFAASGCGGGETSTGPNGGRSDLSGRVALQKSGTGVANALVALVRDGAVQAVAATDGTGVFTFRSIPAGRYTVRLTGLELTGLSLLHYSFDPAEETLDLGGSPRELIFAGVALVPARIDGGVYCGGAPVPGATVRVVGGAADREAGANAQGEFGVTDLDPGHYAVFLVDAPGPCEFGPAVRVVELLRGQEVNVAFHAVP